MGSPYPLVDDAAPIVADGLGKPYYGPTDESKLTATHLDTASEPKADTLAGILSPSLISDTTYIENGNAYAGTASDLPPVAWAKKVAAGASASTVTFWAAARVARGHSQLRIPKKTADWTAAPFYVMDASYARYAAFVFRFRFDSTCKAKAFQALAPTNDAAKLGDYLTRAGGKIEVEAIAMGPEADVKAILSSSKCATNAFAECAKTLTSLADVVDNVGAPATPAAFAPSAAGTAGWFADLFVAQKNQ